MKAVVSWPSCHDGGSDFPFRFEGGTVILGNFFFFFFLVEGIYKFEISLCQCSRVSKDVAKILEIFVSFEVFEP